MMASALPPDFNYPEYNIHFSVLTKNYFSRAGGHLSMCLAELNSSMLCTSRVAFIVLRGFARHRWDSDSFFLTQTRHYLLPHCPPCFCSSDHRYPGDYRRIPVFDAGPHSFGRPDAEWFKFLGWYRIQHWDLLLPNTTTLEATLHLQHQADPRIAELPPGAWAELSKTMLGWNWARIKLTKLPDPICLGDLEYVNWRIYDGKMQNSAGSCIPTKTRFDLDDADTEYSALSELPSLMLDTIEEESEPDESFTSMLQDQTEWMEFSEPTDS